MRSGSVCKRRNRMPNARTESDQNDAITTISTSVSPGAVMNTGRWWERPGEATQPSLILTCWNTTCGFWQLATEAGIIIAQLVVRISMMGRSRTD